MSRTSDVVGVLRMREVARMASEYLEYIGDPAKQWRLSRWGFDGYAEEIVKSLKGNTTPEIKKFKSKSKRALSDQDPEGGWRATVDDFTGDDPGKRLDISPECEAAVEASGEGDILGEVESAIAVPNPTKRSRETLERLKAKIAKQIDSLLSVRYPVPGAPDRCKVAADTWSCDLLAELIVQPTNHLRRQVLEYYGGHESCANAAAVSEEVLSKLCRRALKRKDVKAAVVKARKLDRTNARRTCEESTTRTFDEMPMRLSGYPMAIS